MAVRSFEMSRRYCLDGGWRAGGEVGGAAAEFVVKGNGVWRGGARRPSTRRESALLPTAFNLKCIHRTPGYIPGIVYSMCHRVL